MLSFTGAAVFVVICWMLDELPSDETVRGASSLRSTTSLIFIKTIDASNSRLLGLPAQEEGGYEGADARGSDQRDEAEALVEGVESPSRS